ncbi:MAG: hypothetical protein QME52_01015 [Bacteroidota bacterium]|nr:hypothetical protein [Bacteroidota bacterium]
MSKKPNNQKPQLRRYRKPWTESEENKLRELFTLRLRKEEIAKKLSRSITGIYIRAMNLGLLKPRHKWTRDEELYIKKHYKKTSIKEIAAHLHRTAATVAAHAYQIGLRRHWSWTAENDDYLRGVYGVIPVKKISRKLQKTMSAIYKRANGLRITKPRVFRFWSPEDLHFLRENYLKMSLNGMAKHLNRTYWAIGQKTSRMGLIKSDLIKKKRKL